MSKPSKDVRMRGFAQRTPFRSVLKLIDQQPSDQGNTADLPLEECTNRVLAVQITSASSIPPFRRSAMDGFAIRAEDSYGATNLNPLRLDIIDEVLPGQLSQTTVRAGQAVRIMTGAPVPTGADAVVRFEDCEDRGSTVMIQESVTPGKNIGKVGEDVQAGSVLFRRGRILRPQDIALLAALGVSRVKVLASPRVRLIATGNELLPPGSKNEAGKIVDSNSPMLTSLVRRDGGEVEALLRLPDEPRVIEKHLLAPGADLIVTSGGSSVGKEDYLPGLVQKLGELMVHGVALRPAAPTGIGCLPSTPIFLLPGNPVSCLCAYDLFVARFLRRASGLAGHLPYLQTRKKLLRKITSPLGRTDYVRVQVRGHGVLPLASSGASILSSTTRADGFFLTDENSEGLAAGQDLVLWLYDNPGTTV